MIGDEKLIEALNDLILINNDRIEEYEKAVKTIQTPEYLSLFQRMIAQSIQFKKELINEIKNKTHKVNWKGSTRSGKIYKFWKDIKSSVSKTHSLFISEFCEYLEDAVIKAYKEALSPDVYVPSDITHLMIMQKAKLKESFELLHGKTSMQLVNS